jgi:O-antigen/teichoic acid export membrane protein
VVLVRRRARRLEKTTVPGELARSRETVAAEFWRFSLARSVAAMLEITIVWLDVILVAALATPRDAGIYAAASRFITTGTLAEAAMRIALGPRISGLLALGDVAAAARLVAAGTQWIVLLSWPLYLSLALYSPVVLSVFGPGFTDGATALSMLSVAMLFVMATGNNQTVLLMSGRSLWQMANKLLALIVNIALNLALVPRWGMEGAALAWSATVTVDAAAVLLQVRFAVGVRASMAGVWPALTAALVAFVPIGLFIRWYTEPSVWLCCMGVGGSTILLGLIVWRARHLLEMEPLRLALRRTSRSAG